MPCPQPDDPTPSVAAAATAAHPTEVTTCVRCKTNAAIAIFRDSIYCQECALAVFFQKAKAGLEYARGAGLAKYVAAVKANSAARTVAGSSQASTSSISASPAAATNGAGSRKVAKQINNGYGNSEVDVSANIAVAFSGGPSSRALLRTATQYFRPETAFVNRDARRRKARGEKTGTPSTAAKHTMHRTAGKGRDPGNSAGRFNEVGKIYVFYIDDSAIIPNGEGVDRTEAARKMVEDEACPDLHFVGLKLEDVFRSSSIDEDAFEGVPWKLQDVDSQHISSTASSVSDPTEAIKDLFASLHPTNTPRTGASSARTRIEDLHRLLISALLRRTARQYDCAALLLGDTATRISIRLIEDLAKGAGHKLPVQGSDAVWIDDLLVVRPFKTHLMQDVLFYISALGLEQLQPEQHVVPPTVSTADVLSNTNSNIPAMDKSSIARLTETFILNLEKGVPSTVTTIGKTGSKLVLNAPAVEANGETSVSASASHSTSAFQHVGPSVSLRSRTGVSEEMAGMTFADASEPRIGSRGMRLAQASASCFRWNTITGCALCGMPSQHPKARHWKRDITISSLAETAPSQQITSTRAGDANGEGEWIELSDHLCYACLLVLAPPIAVGGEQENAVKSLLPAYVLRHVRRSNAEKGSEGLDAVGLNNAAGGKAEDEDTAQTGQHGNCGSHNPTPQPLKRSEIKAQINEFLLDEA
ncbi:hypothetical protein EX895_004928 [Sporisorium graminicola]|uniref:Cytoplasmic tRNA 2-thiolation protein 2 n=1 Tax=Sporisorium graminicola TaxID=280036 RepID=A0A4U7KPF4_9BASI|nr:hypothetical protein EX895_004928 [Sporisorium graminicola]TKY86103.1 hypothetical protein EX895_004928 [Sporisorium graminicola]